jgi:hypothetical protein
VAAQDNEAADADAGDVAAEAGDDEARTDRQRERDRQPDDTERDRRQDDTDEDAPADEADELDGEDFDCIDFQVQEDAQEILDEDPDDPYNLDPNADGIACALLPSEADVAGENAGSANEQTSNNGTGQRRRDRTDAPADDADAAANCADLTQEEAVEILDDDPDDPQGLDPDGDGIPCEDEEIGAPPDDAETTRTNRRDTRTVEEEEPAARDRQTSTAEFEDLDCEDFTFREEAQLVLDDLPADPYNLDPNADGIACSSLPTSTDTVQVTAVPRTGTGPNTDVDPAWAIVPLAAAAAAAHGLRVRGFLHDRER